MLSVSRSPCSQQASCTPARLQKWRRQYRGIVPRLFKTSSTDDSSKALKAVTGPWDLNLATAHMSNLGAGRVITDSTWEPPGDESAAVAVLFVIGVGVLAAYAQYSIQDRPSSSAVLCVTLAS
jgi:hypothetical protein